MATEYVYMETSENIGMETESMEMETENMETPPTNNSAQPVSGSEKEGADLNTNSNTVGEDDIFDAIEKEYEDLRKLSKEEALTTEFDSHDAAVAWYAKYGRAWGFNTRLHNKKHNETGAISERLMVCSAQGCRKKMKKVETKGGHQEDEVELEDETNKANAPRREPMMDTRFYCKAFVKFVLDTTKAKYRIDKLENFHTHPMAQLRFAHHMRSNRSVGEAEMEFLRQSREAGLRTCDATFYGHKQVSLLFQGSLSLCFYSDLANTK